MTVSRPREPTLYCATEEIVDSTLGMFGLAMYRAS